MSNNFINPVNPGTIQTIQGTTGTIAVPNNYYYINYNGGTQISLPLVDGIVPEIKKNTDGCVCKKCKELYPYAEPNQDDGSLICYSCRVSW